MRGPGNGGRAHTRRQQIFTVTVRKYQQKKIMTSEYNKEKDVKKKRRQKKQNEKENSKKKHKTKITNHKIQKTRQNQTQKRSKKKQPTTVRATLHSSLVSFCLSNKRSNPPPSPTFFPLHAVGGIAASTQTRNVPDMRGSRAKIAKNFSASLRCTWRKKQSD